MSKLSVDLKKIWTFSLVVYIICSSAFSYGDLRMLNTYALYFFLGVSAFCILMKAKIKYNIVVVSLVLYTVIILLGTFYTPSKEEKVLAIVYDYITMAVITICVVQYIGSIEDISTIITAFMWAGVALALYVYAQYGEEFWVLMQEATEYESGYVGRLDGDLANANVIGMYAAISTIIAVYKLIYQKNKLWKSLLYIAVAVFCFVIDMAAASKKGVLFLAIAAFCIWLYSAMGNKNILKQIRNLTVLVLAVVAVFWLLTNLKMFSAITLRIEEFMGSLNGGPTDESSIQRSYMSEAGLKIWLTHPLLGAGTYSSQYYFGVYSHNNYVEILMNSGLVGFVIFYIPQVSGVFKYLANYKTYKESSKLTGLLFALLVGILVCGVGFVYYYDRYFMILIATIVSATVILKSRPKTQKSDGDVTK